MQRLVRKQCTLLRQHLQHFLLKISIALSLVSVIVASRSPPSSSSPSSTLLFVCLPVTVPTWPTATCSRYIIWRILTMIFGGTFKIASTSLLGIIASAITFLPLVLCSRTAVPCLSEACPIHFHQFIIWYSLSFTYQLRRGWTSFRVALVFWCNLKSIINYQ